jgi:hypothetical protein
MANEDLEYKVKIDQSDIQSAQRGVDKLLISLKKVEDFEKEKARRQKSTWGSLGRSTAAGGAIAAGGAAGVAASALGGSLPGVYAGTAVAVAGSMKALGSVVQGTTKLMAQMAKGLGEVGSGLPWVGGLFKGVGAMAAAGIGAMGMVAGQRMQVANRWADYQKIGAQIRLGGGGQASLGGLTTVTNATAFGGGGAGGTTGGAVTAGTSLPGGSGGGATSSATSFRKMMNLASVGTWGFKDQPTSPAERRKKLEELKKETLARAATQNWSTAEGVPLGMTPQEVQGLKAQAAISAGFKGAMAGDSWKGAKGGAPWSLVTAARTYGASAGAVGGLAGAFAAGSRRSGVGMVAAAIRAGTRDGLRGSQLDRMLGEATQTITQLASMGITTGKQYGQLLEGMQRSLGKRAPAGTAGRTVSALAKMPGSAKQQLLAPFAQATNALMLAEAAKRGGGTLGGILGGLEGMGPAGALGALRGAPGIGRAILAQYMPYSATGRALGARRVKGGREFALGEARVDKDSAAWARAKGVGSLMATQKPDDAAKLITSMTNLQVEVNALVGRLDTFLNILPNAIAKAIKGVTN